MVSNTVGLMEVNSAAVMLKEEVAHAAPLPFCAMRTLGAVEVPCNVKERDAGL